MKNRTFKIKGTIHGVNIKMHTLEEITSLVQNQIENCPPKAGKDKEVTKEKEKLREMEIRDPKRKGK